jgi:uncharacterized protein YdgA (DUF945 family)
MGFISDKLSYMMEQIHRQVIKPLINANFGKQESYPEIKFTKLGDVDHPAVSGALSQLASAGLIKITPKTTQLIHKQFDLNAISDEEVKEMEIAELEAEMQIIEGEQSQDDLDIDSIFSEGEEIEEETEV